VQAQPLPWRTAVDGLCHTHPIAECQALADLEPAFEDDGAARAAVGAAVFVTAAALELAGLPSEALAIRAVPGSTAPEAMAAVQDRLMAAFVTLLPPGARRATRSWSSVTWWVQFEQDSARPVWRRRVHDEGSPPASQRELLVIAARFLQRVTGRQVVGEAALDEATDFGTQAIAHGAPGGPILHGLLALVANLPQQPTPVAPVDQGPPERPSRRQVVTALESARASVTRCVGPFDGTVNVRITFGPDGQPTDATITGGFANSAVGSCARAAVMDVHVPAFESEAQTVTYPYVVYGAHPDRTPPVPVLPPAIPPRPHHVIPVQAILPVTHDERPVASPADSLEGALAALDVTVRACVPGRRGTVTLTVTVAGTGEADHVTAAGRFADTERECMEAAVMNAHFPQFSGPARRIERACA